MVERVLIVNLPNSFLTIIRYLPPFIVMNRLRPFFLVAYICLHLGNKILNVICEVLCFTLSLISFIFMCIKLLTISFLSVKAHFNVYTICLTSHYAIGFERERL